MKEVDFKITELRENEILIDGIFREYLELEALIKPMEKRMKELKDWCKALGNYTTDRHICIVKQQERTQIVSLKEAVDILGRDFLNDKGMIKVISFPIVTVSSRFGV